MLQVYFVHEKGNPHGEIVMSVDRNDAKVLFSKKNGIPYFSVRAEKCGETCHGTIVSSEKFDVCKR